ncbi:restriction endonuclease subunit S [Colwellia sp. MB02u-6]|uniref:restriction endonuclease subunit S n=1 Tax=Colwellia sp. MB02u-6 TaxID=2759824 RepID=UPI0015F45259|nr:restriction endonuclease subunit S [Colwellia sp. MB02u-6]MBA6328133.1 restriction endonuclease subunit S [Colwellia sp. MB02u-6]
MNLDKSSWKTYSIAKLLLKKEENDKEKACSRFDKYLKVEHLDAETLHIKRWASQKNGDELPPTFYKIFRKGQILFPTRNPHLKRTAIAHFEGICGEKTLTLEVNKKLARTEFLKFLFHSEHFYQHSISSIIGSTNPHVRWRDIEKLEVLVPPLSVQDELASLFFSADQQIQANLGTLEKLKVLEKSIAKSLINEYSNKSNKKVKLGSLYTKKLKSVKPQDLEDEEVLHYSLPSFIDKKVPERVIASSIKSNKLVIDDDVILFSKLNPNTPKVWAITKSEGNMKLGSTEWLPIRPTEDLPMLYLTAYLESHPFIQKILRLVQGTSNSHKRVDPKMFYDIEVPIPTKEFKLRMEAKIKKILLNKANLELVTTSSQSLLKSIVNEVF